MSSKDKLSFLDAKEDKLSFLDRQEPKEDKLSFLDNQITPEQTEDEFPFWIDPRIKQFMTTKGTKEYTKGIERKVKHGLSGATLGLSEKIDALNVSEDEEGFGDSAMEFIGAMIPWTGLEAAVAKFGPKVATKVAQKTGTLWKPMLAQLGTKAAIRTTGAAGMQVLKNLAKNGELPNTKEMVKNAAMVGVVGGVFDVFSDVLMPVHQSLKNIANEYGVPTWEAYKKLGKAIMNKGYSLFKGQGTRPLTEEAVKEATDGLIQQITEKGITTPIPKKLPKQAVPKETTPIKPVKEVTKEIVQPIEKPKLLSLKPKAEIKQQEKPSPAEKKPEETVVHSAFVPPQIQDLVNATIEGGKKLGKSKSEIGQLGWKAVAKWYGDKNYAKWISSQKWDKLGKDLPKTVQEDMLYYREKTGNPFKPNDTAEKLSKRLSPENKRVVDEVIDKHFEDGLKLINNAKYLKPLKPRELVRNIFVPHFYEGTDINNKISEAYRKLGKKFNTKNPFENKRTFLTFDEAFKKAGLKPKYTNIIDSLKAYDGIVSRLISNNELLGSVKDFEKKNSLKIIRRKTAKTSEQYADALNAGWIPFYDPSLRVVFDGTSAKVSDAPALIHPDLAESMAGVFQKKPTDFAPSIFKKIGGYYDAISSGLRNLAVNLSGFHFVALAESFVGAIKWKDLFHASAWWKKGGALLTDPKIMEPALKAGLKIDYGAEQSQEFMERHMNKINDWLRTKNWKLNPSKAYETAFLKPYVAYQNFLWKVYHPRLKINTWYQYRQDFIKQVTKKGEIVTPEELKVAEAKIAEQVNNIFGGQVWELQKYFNDPDVRKWMYRLVGYPDWSISAIKQGAEAGKSGFRGNKGRWYWVKYVAAWITFQNVINFITTGHSTFKNDDPKHRFDFALPDIKITVKGKEYNLSRDEKGRKYYSHTGKQMLELGRYYTDTLAQLFNKSNPLFQAIAKQIIGYTPSKGGGFPVQGEFKDGKFVPWKGKKGVKQIPSRLKEVAQTVLPFSIRGTIQHPGASLLTAGSLPITKSLSLYDAGKYLTKEFEKEKPDFKEIAKIKRAVKASGYTETQLINLVKRTRTKVQKEKNAKKLAKKKKK